MKKSIYKKMKFVLIFLIIFCSLLGSFFSYYSLAEFKFKDLQKKAADINEDGNINYKDMEILVDQKFPQRPVDGVKNQSGEGYLVDLFSQSTYRSSSTIASGDVIKVLIIGNSYTYFGEPGGILAEIAHRAGYRIIVVEAVKPVTFGYGFLHSSQLSMYCWDYSGNTLKTKKLTNKKSLFQIAESSDLERPKKWDYVFLQDQEIEKAKNYKADKEILTKFVNRKYIDSADRFIINANKQKAKGGYNSANKKGGSVAKKAKYIGAGIVYTGEILFKKSHIKTFPDLKIHDRAKKGFVTNHPTAKAQYIYALIMYAKVFGTDKLASSSSPNSFIEAYNDVGKNYRSFVKELREAYKGRKVSNYQLSINKNEAIKYQKLVYSCYNDYIK